jgi:hypothetical protein
VWTRPSVKVKIVVVHSRVVKELWL